MHQRRQFFTSLSRPTKMVAKTARYRINCVQGRELRRETVGTNLEQMLDTRQIP